VTRSSRLAMSLAALALVLSACGSDVPRGVAATVDGTEIPRSTIEAWVREAVTGNSLLDQPELQRELLSWAIQARIVESVLAERGLTIPDDGTAKVLASVEESVGGADALPGVLTDVGFPPDFFRDVFLVREAGIEAIVTELARGRVLETRTARHILVETAEEAAEVYGLLVEGADFADLALERSLDPGSAQQGGQLGAQERGAFVAPFDAAVWAATLDTILEPVETEYGFHVIEVIDAVRVEASQLGMRELRQLVLGELDEILGEALARAQVAVDRRIGVWDPVSGSVGPATGNGQG